MTGTSIIGRYNNPMIGYKWFDMEGFLWRHHFKSLLSLSMLHIDPRLSHNKAQQLVRDRANTDYGIKINEKMF